jgi:hypothetical protein
MTRCADSASTAGRDPRVTVPPYRIKPRDMCRRIVHPGEALLLDGRDGERGRCLALLCTGGTPGYGAALADRRQRNARKRAGSEYAEQDDRVGPFLERLCDRATAYGEVNTRAVRDP